MTVASSHSAAMSTTATSTGCMEAAKAATLSSVLDLPIDPEHMVLSHTPMRAIASVYGGAALLVTLVVTRSLRA